MIIFFHSQYGLRSWHELGIVQGWASFISFTGSPCYLKPVKNWQNFSSMLLKCYNNYSYNSCNDVYAGLCLFSGSGRGRASAIKVPAGFNVRRAGAGCATVAKSSSSLKLVDFRSCYLWRSFVYSRNSGKFTCNIVPCILWHAVSSRYFWLSVRPWTKHSAAWLNN